MAQLTPRSELADGLGWIALGAAILIGSVTMDRLERQGVNPYTVPGLLPGLLGVAMMLLGGVLALRSWRRAKLHPEAPPADHDEPASRRRIVIVLGMCLGFAVGLVGHGLPFWLAASIFVTCAILVLQRLSSDPETRQLSLMSVAKALAIGLGAAAAIHLVFQDLFLVHLP